MRRANGYSVVVSTSYSLDTRDKPSLLFSMMRTFASEQSSIAFEGNLASSELFTIEGGSHDEVGVLRRVTTAPQLDFLVLPLLPTRLPETEKAIRSKIAFSGYKGIIHVQIAVKDEIVFGAYDNFGRESVVVNDAISPDVLDDLVKAQTLRSYSPAMEHSSGVSRGRSVLPFGKVRVGGDTSGIQNP
jgi:hypothetical protein